MLKVTERARRVAPRAAGPLPLADARRARPPAAAKTAKPWAFEAGTRAIQAHCDRIGLKAEAARDLETPGVYHLEPRLTEEPLVSIVIPTGGPAARGPLPGRRPGRALRRRASSATSTYKNLRDRRRRRFPRPRSDPRAPARARRRAPPAGRVRDGSSTSPRRSTAAPSTAAASYLLILNDDMEVIDAGLDRADGHVRRATRDRRGRRSAALAGRPHPARRDPVRERRLPGPPLLRLPRPVRRLLEQHPGRPELTSPRPAPA